MTTAAFVPPVVLVTLVVTVILAFIALRSSPAVVATHTTKLAAVVPTSRDFQLSSSAFSSGEPLPKVYTCTDGEGNTHTGISPPLAWQSPPAGIVEFFLIQNSFYGKGNMERYDWIVYGIPADADHIDEDGSVAVGGILGGAYPGVPIEYMYRAPCSPISGTHTFYYSIYALNASLKERIQRGEAKDYAPDIVSYIEENKMVLAKATLETTNCRCGCDEESAHGGGTTCLDR